MKQHGFGILAYLLAGIALVGMLSGLAWKIRESGKDAIRLEWGEANRKAEEAAAVLAAERALEGRKAAIALQQAEKEARTNAERWRQARNALRDVPFAVCRTPRPASPDAASASVEAPRPDSGLLLTWAYVLLHDRAWTGPAGGPVFSHPAGTVAATATPGAASSYGLDQLLENHQANAERCSENARQLGALIALIKQLSQTVK